MMKIAVSSWHAAAGKSWLWAELLGIQVSDFAEPDTLKKAYCADNVVSATKIILCLLTHVTNLLQYAIMDT